MVAVEARRIVIHVSSSPQWPLIPQLISPLYVSRTLRSCIVSYFSIEICFDILPRCRRLQICQILISNLFHLISTHLQIQKPHEITRTDFLSLLVCVMYD